MLHFELVTPERVVYRQEVEQVTLPTSLGEITIMQNHEPLIATLVPGIAKLKTKKGDEEVAVSGGFIEVSSGNKIRVLADTAERGFELELSVIEEAKKRAEQVMREAVKTDDASYAMAAAALERELARYRVAHKHRGGKKSPTIDRANLPPDENPV